ncbi:unnamed protein product, partial [Candidula unifasciata]
VSLVSDRAGEATQGRLRSLPSPGRPPSRGSPTTDLYHTRERTSSGRDRRKKPNLTEPAGRKEQDQRQTRGRVKDYEERSAGSDVEVFSNLTRSSSVASNRLKALQEEIEKLKEGVARANERANQPPLPAQIYHMPAPAAAAVSAQQQQDPGYFDPFDDPYGFMRMPRRRANSFSGGREREWDEWYWTLPQNCQYDGGDIPLGYAAADAYADLPVSSAQQRPTRENFKNRLRQRRVTNERQREDVQVNYFYRRQSRSPSHQAAGRSHSQSRYRVREYSRLSDSDEEERISR